MLSVAILVSFVSFALRLAKAFFVVPEAERRSTRPVLSAICFLAASAPCSAWAEAPPTLPDARLSLTLAQAISRADARAPDVVMAHHAVREAEARRVGAGVVFPANPRLSVDARPPVTGGAVIADIGYGATLDLPFEVGGAPAARVREADRWAGVARAELGVERLRSRDIAWTAYLRAKVAEQRIVELELSLAIAERVLAASRQRADAGASADIEQSLASAEVAQLQLAIQQSARAQRTHVMELKDALDMPALEPVALVTRVEEPPPAPSDQILVSRALEMRPELAVIKQRIMLLDATGDRLRKELFPRMGMYVGVDAAPQSPIFGMVGLSIELPVAQRNQGPRARVEAARAGEVTREDLTARRIVRDVLAARDAYEARRIELRVLTESALPSVLRTLELVEIGWRAGRFDVFRVTTAARDVARVRGQRLDALEAAWMERIAIDRAVGGMGT